MQGPYSVGSRGFGFGEVIESERMKKMPTGGMKRTLWSRL